MCVSPHHSSSRSGPDVHHVHTGCPNGQQIPSRTGPPAPAGTRRAGTAAAGNDPSRVPGDGLEEVDGMGKNSKPSKAGKVLASDSSSKPAKSKAGSTLGKG